MAYHPKSQKERVLHRFKIAAGQLEKIISMVESGSYCVNIIHQSQAVQMALKQADFLILENHLKTCAAESIRKGKDKKVINEIMNVIKQNK